MASVQLYQFFVIDSGGGNALKGGSLSQAKTIELGDDEVSDQTFKIAKEGKVKIWDAAEDEAMGDFAFLWLEADACEFGPATVLGSDLAHQFDGSVDLFDGTEDVIEEIWAHNPSTTDVARVRRVVAT